MLVDKSGWQHYVYQADKFTLRGTYVQAAEIELYLNDFATTTQVHMLYTGSQYHIPE